jgi:hypothetical protein
MKTFIATLAAVIFSLPGIITPAQSSPPQVKKSGAITYINIGISQPNVEDCYEMSVPGTGIDNSWINIFPNPNPGRFTLEVHLQQPGTSLVISIYDITGKAVYESPETTDGILFQKDLDFGHLQKGIYLIRIMGKDRVGVKRIVIN